MPSVPLTKLIPTSVDCAKINLVFEAPQSAYTRGRIDSFFFSHRNLSDMASLEDNAVDLFDGLVGIQSRFYILYMVCEQIPSCIVLCIFESRTATLPINTTNKADTIRRSAVSLLTAMPSILGSYV